MYYFPEMRSNISRNIFTYARHNCTKQYTFLGFVFLLKFHLNRSYKLVDTLQLKLHIKCDKVEEEEYN